MAGRGLTETPIHVYRHKLSLGEKILLASSVRVSKCWIMLAKALTGKETSGQGGFVARDELEVETTSTICQGNLIPGKLSFKLLKLCLGLFKLFVKCNHSQS